MLQMKTSVHKRCHEEVGEDKFQAKAVFSLYIINYKFIFHEIIQISLNQNEKCKHPRDGMHKRFFKIEEDILMANKNLLKLVVVFIVINVK